MRGRGKIGRTLLDDLEAAKERLRAAQEEFHKLLKDVPSGLSVADGSPLLHRAARAQRQSLVGLKMAVERHTDFVLHGIVPADLLDESDEKETRPLNRKPLSGPR